MKFNFLLGLELRGFWGYWNRVGGVGVRESCRIDVFKSYWLFKDIRLCKVLVLFIGRSE